jgi:altronate hydrolase
MTSMPSDRSGTVQLHPDDDVVIARVALAAGTVVQTDRGDVKLTQDVAAGHKVACRARAVGEPVHRYGQVIGFASVPIQPGEHVHLHNLHVGEIGQIREVVTDKQPVTCYPPERTRSFQGYLRPDGRVGTRNYLAIVPTVNCAASVAAMVRDRFRDVSRDYPNVDGVVALTHKGGCGEVANGLEVQFLQRVLAGYAQHPNVCAYVVLGLGCEVNQPVELIERRGLTQMSRPASGPPLVTIQSAGGTRKAVEAVSAEIERLLPRANQARRTQRPASDLVLATNCGGSDGYSGITANPALGWAVDELVRNGGTGLLAETTEIYGAQQILIRRALNGAVAQKLIDRIDWWRRQLQLHGGDVDHNPSPGNLAGGITTVLEKALGGVTKGGTTPLVDVIEYGERIAAKGLVYMDTPAYDPTSVTGLVAGGANIVCFTTGRGSVYGCKPVPSIKLATNTRIYRQMQDDMDLDCGLVLDGVSIEEMGRRVFEEVLEVASGKRTASERLGIGDEEFAPWLPGPTL